MNLAPKEAPRMQVKDDINDLVEGGADAHVLLCIQPTGLVGISLRRLHHTAHLSICVVRVRLRGPCVEEHMTGSGFGPDLKHA